MAEAGPTSGLMAGKRALILGVANDHSIAWGIAKVLHAAGAELAFTYQGEGFGRRVEPLARSLGAEIVLPADVQDPASLDALFAEVGRVWGGLDVLVHAIAYSDKAELDGRFLDTSRENFLRSLDISCYSLVDLTRRAAPLMTQGGSIITLTYIGAQRVTPNYNVMGVAKAALESAVRYLASDLGPQGVRVNAISPGPMRTLAGAAIAGARKVYRATEMNAPLRANASLEAVGGAALYLASDLSISTTGEIIFVDGGYHVTGMAQPENL
ncbi:MAG TPA: enoyl-ACP reductase [Amaricoccus sp.]|uniref:enoyl-ACP reductase FabI n=1 Tax=Amaricoccus sp. TaxID=1872485 RepID=UPI002CA98107|nr:enoyl-ACP reductase [Amaricoccus sp.]HMQ93553.1 enoyl-ACP reductase [Amaricoccus sp.]HMR54447.1 enoyl-ACP reductase [Amaricoccus sp.]HMR60965.1 enoyl-ACP reductase [Amaricoccus sp.]HMU01454.1 enoyl-ACP reductase [Amaricoccus sp.]